MADKKAVNNEGIDPGSKSKMLEAVAATFAGDVDLNSHFMNLAKSDVLNSVRVNDTIKERLTTSLLSKVDSMDAPQILDCIERLDNTKVISSYQELCKLMSNN